MKANIIEEVGTRKEKKPVRSLRKSASDLSLTGLPSPSLGGWLESLGLKQYESHFLREGLDSIEIVRHLYSIFNRFLSILILSKLLVEYLYYHYLYIYRSYYFVSSLAVIQFFTYLLINSFTLIYSYNVILT